MPNNVVGMKVQDAPNDYSVLARMKAWKSSFGNMFGGTRDLYSVFGYRKVIQFSDMLDKYQRQDIAGRVVEAEPRATWSDPPLLAVDNGVVGEGVFNDIWKDLISNNNLYEVFNRLDKLVGMGRYAVLLVGVDDGLALKEPVSGSSTREILYLQPYSELSAEIIEYEDDHTSPRFGKPKMYRINPHELVHKTSSLATRTFKQRGFEVHHSRILHVSENGLEDEIFGNPRLERVYNLLDDILKTVGGAAETYWLTANRGLQVDVDKDLDFKPEDAQDLSDEIDEYQENLRRVIRTKGVKIHNLGSDVADPRGTFGVITALLAGATGIPQRILLGSEAGQLASEQDRANWANRITERRKLFAEPTILLPFIRMLVEMRVLPLPTSLEFHWPDAFKQNPLERSQTSAQKARALSNVSKALSSDVPVVSLDEGRAIIGVTGPAPIVDESDDIVETADNLDDITSPEPSTTPPSPVEDEDED